MRRRALLVPLLLAGLAACAPAAADHDGEVFAAGPMPAAAPKTPDAVPVVIDTDLAPDDLAAIALLVRHPRVDVVGITVPETGMVTCAGLGLLADLFDAMETPAPPVACGRTPRGPEGLPFPPQWTTMSTVYSGLDRDDEPGGLAPVRRPAADFLGDLARRHDGLQVVALGPLTEVAALLRQQPGAYARIAAITSMAGNYQDRSQGIGIAEWNAAADPVPFAEVVAGPVPLTILPDDPVPEGAPAGLAGPVVGGLGRHPQFTSPAYWDLATAGSFVQPDVATTQSGTWEVDTTGDRGRLRRTGDGPVRVVTRLDTAALDRVYAATFG